MFLIQSYFPQNMIIGITGYYASGKDEVADYLIKRSFIHHSLSDEIRIELKKRKKKITRENLINLGNELRKEHGPDILAKRVIKKLDNSRHQIITSIRNPHALESLRNLDNFILISVNSPINQRFERIKKRKREGDPKTIEELREKEKIEESNISTNQQLHIVTKKADIVINNNGTLEDLHKKIDKFLEDWWPKLIPKKPTWDEYFFEISKTVSTRSNCMKRKVGSIIVRNKRIISTGYNGSPKGTKNCDEGGCKRCNSFSLTGQGFAEECICSHAEENAIIQAAYHGISVKNATLYTTLTPCTFCAKLIINGGIKEVVCNQKNYVDKGASDLMKKAGVKIKYITTTK